MQALRDGKVISGKQVGKVVAVCKRYNCTDGSLVDCEEHEYPVMETETGDRFGINDGCAIAFTEEDSDYKTISYHVHFYPDD